MSDISIISTPKGRPPKPIKCHHISDTDPVNFYKNRPSECKKCFSKKSNNLYLQKEFGKVVNHIMKLETRHEKLESSIQDLIAERNQMRFELDNIKSILRTEDSDVVRPLV
jgi:K+/H+ antiporter YhaU regulatory subunit KhtT